MKDHVYAHTRGIAMAVLACRCGKDKCQDKSSIIFFSASGNGTLMVQKLSTTRILNCNREFFQFIAIPKQRKNLKMCCKLFVALLSIVKWSKLSVELFVILRNFYQSTFKGNGCWVFMENRSEHFMSAF